MKSNGRAKILIVDDNREKLIALGAVLSDLGTVVKVNSGTEALGVLLDQDVAVVLLDVNMPEINGFETASLIRGRDSLKYLPILFISGMDPTAQDIERGYSLGAVDYLFNAGSPAAIRAKVSVFVQLFEQRKEIQRTRDALKDINAQLESFCHSVAHDLRAPLRSIRGFSQALLDDHAAALDDTGKDFLKRILGSSGRMDELITDLLNYSRVSTAELRLEPIDLEPFIESLIGKIKEEMSGADFKMEKPLGTVMAHPEILQQVFINLFSNACKYTQPNTPPEIRVRAEDSGKSICVWIEDKGIGIAEEFHERIFGMFERLHHGKDYPGTGVGLAIVRKGLERMGGRVGVNSIRDQGSSFWLTLPKAREQSSPPEPR